MPIIVLLLLVAGLIALRLASRQIALVGLPPGRVVFLDTSKLSRLTQALYDPATGLTGRPDYLVKKMEGIVPVELKSGRAPLQPYPGHVYQLAAYCLLVGAVYGQRPKYGIVKYADRAFAIDFDARLEHELLDVLAEMRRCEQRVPDRSHHSVRRCRTCGHRENCDQRLD